MEWHIEDFLDRFIGKLARNSRTDPEAAEQAVFNAMWQEINADELAKLLRFFLWSCRGYGSSQIADAVECKFRSTPNAVQ